MSMTTFRTQHHLLWFLVASLFLIGIGHASGKQKQQEPEFKSTLFKKGKLVYSDDFDGKYNKVRWGMPKGKEIKDGTLIVTARFPNAEVAQKTLKRDHHLGLDPEAHLNKIPEKFVCHMRYKFEAEALGNNRPIFQIGHHMILLMYKKGGGHRVTFSADKKNGPHYQDAKSDMKINEWVDLIIEYEHGKILISVNGSSKVSEGAAVTFVNKKDKHKHRFTMKHGIQSPKSRIVFDYVRLWEVVE